MTHTLQASAPSPNLSSPGVLVVLGTGGTIAGVNHEPGSRAYRAAQLPVSQLLQGLPAWHAGCSQAAGKHWQVESQQVAQVDSKDMNWSVWRHLLVALQHHLSRPEVEGVVITHGTDTLEETAVLLHVLMPHRMGKRPLGKPVVLTAAMRPATAPDADGPRNLADALTVAAWAAQQHRPGVVAVMEGRVWAGEGVRKAHSCDVDAFDAGGASALAMVSDNVVTPLVDEWPEPLGWLSVQAGQSADWAVQLPDTLPQVDLLVAHADADARLLQALVNDVSVRGLVLAGTGHGTLPATWDSPLRQAHARGVVIWRSTRVARGGVHGEQSSSSANWPAAGSFTAAQARLLLALALWCRPDKALHPDTLVRPVNALSK